MQEEAIIIWPAVDLYKLSEACRGPQYVISGRHLSDGLSTKIYS